jgi:hypothetical protein
MPKTRTIDSISDALDDQAAAVEHLLNAVSLMRRRLEGEASRQGPHAGRGPELESVEQLIGISWEMMRVAVDLLREARTPLGQHELLALAEVDRILVRTRQ